MFKSINLNNYKCFEKMQMDISPLTIICGTNSSGKSSIINSLLMLKQSYENNFAANNMILNGSYIKCGLYEDISTDRNNLPITFDNEYELIKPKEFRASKGDNVSKFDITAFKTLSKIYPQKENITKFVLKSHIVIKKHENMSQMKDNIIDEYIIEIQPCGNDGVITVTKIILRNIQDKNYVITVENMPDGSKNTMIPIAVLKNCVCYFENFTLINAYATYITPKGTLVDGILANIYLIFRINAMQYKNINYLTPLRVYPQRNYILDNETENVGLSGEFTPHIMYEYSDKKIYGFYPPKDEVLAEGTSREQFTSFMNAWMNYLGFGEYSLKQVYEMIKLEISNYNISNVGFGVSQVLPILVSGLIQKKNEVLLLEQPEIHLHPSAQMCIADFLISMAINQRGVIIETHSDHILNRIIKRILQDKSGMLNQKVKIYYVDGANRENPIISIIVDPQKGITNAPPQFFTQFGSESMLIAKCAMENYREGIKW